MRSLLSVCIAALGLSFADTARADVKLPTVIGSHMVLQRDRPLPIWGWADAGEEVGIAQEAVVPHAGVAVASDAHRRQRRAPRKRRP